jgi:threonine dehydrogenase-like Zn-dependent dehydrogenase
MKANCWYGRNDVRVEDVPDPKILNPRDAIVKITSTAICGSDLHLYDGYVPTMEGGDILGHEFMGEVVELGKQVQPAGGRPGRRPIPDLVRQLLFLRRSALLPVRKLQPQRLDG